MTRFEGKVAIVTGGASGIGEAVSKQLAREGAAVVIADFAIERATLLATEIVAEGHKATSVFLDAGKPESVKEMIDYTIETYGRLDVLHNNVGITDLKTDLDVVALDMDTWDRVMNVNVKSYVLGCKYAIPHMIKNGGGSIVNTASMSAFGGDLIRTAYGASKAAVVNLTKYVATQYGKSNIRCNAVAPGLVLTPAAKNNLPDKEFQMFLSHNSLPYLGEPEDIAHAVTFLASEEARYITGQTIEADGGWFIHSSTYADFMKLYSEAQAK